MPTGSPTKEVSLYIFFLYPLLFIPSLHIIHIISQPTSSPSQSPSAAPTVSDPLKASIEAVNLALGALTAVDNSGPTEKRLDKALKDLNEDPADLAGALKDAEKASKKLRCPEPRDTDAIASCEVIQAAIDVLKDAL